MTPLSLQAIADALEALRSRAGISKTALAERMGVAQSTVSKMAGGRSLTVENLLAWLRAVDADLHGLAAAVAAVPAADGSSPVSRLAGLDHAPRAVDLHQDARRLLAEAERLQREDPSDGIDRAVQQLRLTVAQLQDVVQHTADRAWSRAEEIAESDEAPDRMTEEQFQRALRLLRTMVKRAVAEERDEADRVAAPPGSRREGAER